MPGYIDSMKALMAPMLSALVEAEYSKAKYRRKDYSEAERRRRDEYNREHFPDSVNSEVNDKETPNDAKKD